MLTVEYIDYNRLSQLQKYQLTSRVDACNYATTLSSIRSSFLVLLNTMCPFVALIRLQCKLLVWQWRNSVQKGWFFFCFHQFLKKSRGSHAHLNLLDKVWQFNNVHTILQTHQVEGIFFFTMPSKTPSIPKWPARSCESTGPGSRNEMEKWPGGHKFWDCISNFKEFL